jgi:hypothetical protein
MVPHIEGIIGAVAAIAATFAAPFVWGWWEERGNNRKLLGHNNLLRTWRSTWQTNATDGRREWVNENVNVDVAKGKLLFANDDNDGEYEWTGEAQVVGNSYLCGTWKSNKKTSSCGTFILALTDSGPKKQGDALVGFFLGPNDGGTANYGAWAMARHSRDLESAKERLRVVGPTLHEIYRQASS